MLRGRRRRMWPTGNNPPEDPPPGRSLCGVLTAFCSDYRLESTGEGGARQPRGATPSTHPSRQRLTGWVGRLGRGRPFFVAKRNAIWEAIWAVLGERSVRRTTALRVAEVSLRPGLPE